MRASITPNEAPRTSITHPMRVDWVHTIGQGKIGITICPGKRSRSLTGPAWRRDAKADLIALRRQGVHRLVTLLEDYEFATHGLGSREDFMMKVGQSRLQMYQLPIPDVSTPSSGQVGLVTQLVEQIIAEAALGYCFAIHCIGGLGRSGLVAGCVLRHVGLSVSATFELLQRARGPRCPETDAQRRYVRSWGTSAELDARDELPSSRLSSPRFDLFGD